jgi:hypothetical protein
MPPHIPAPSRGVEILFIEQALQPLSVKNGLGQDLKADEGAGQKSLSDSPRSCRARSPSRPAERAAAMSTPASQNVRITKRSETSSSPTRYLALELSSREHLFARRLDLLPDTTELLAEL